MLLPSHPDQSSARLMGPWGPWPDSPYHADTMEGIWSSSLPHSLLALLAPARESPQATNCQQAGTAAEGLPARRLCQGGPVPRAHPKHRQLMGRQKEKGCRNIGIRRLLQKYTEKVCVPGAHETYRKKREAIKCILEIANKIKGDILPLMSSSCKQKRSRLEFISRAKKSPQGQSVIADPVFCV